MLRRLYLALLGIGRAIGRAEDPSVLFAEACRLAVDAAGYRGAWIGIADPSDRDTIAAVAAAGAIADRVAHVRISIADPAERSRGIGTSIRERRSVVIDDVLDEPRMQPWWAEAREIGYRSIVAVPLVRGEILRGVLVVYAAGAGAFGIEQTALLERLAEDIGYRLEVLEADRERRAAEARFVALFEQSRDGIFVADASGRFVDANPAACRMLGFDLETLRGMSVQSLLDGLPAELEVRRVRHPDGRMLDIEVSAQHLPNGAVQGIMRDVTERLAAEMETRRLAAAVDQASEAILMTDDDGAITYVNRAFSRITGFAAVEVLGRVPWRTARAPGEAARLEGMERAYRRGEPWVGPMRLTIRGGTVLDLDLAVWPMRDPAGAPVGSVIVVRDVTRVRALEQQLRQSQRLEAVGRLARGISHEFNNVLTAISGYADLLQADLAPDDPRRLDAIEIVRAAERASALTRQLLAFSSKQVLHPRLVHLGETLDGIAPMLRRLIGEDVQLVIRRGPDGTTMADPAQLEQVIVNLAMNAREAMPSGGTLTLETGSAEVDTAFAAGRLGAEPGSYVTFAVADTGTGIEPDVLDHIFEPFFAPRLVGTGGNLGLAATYGVIRQSAGFIDVASGPQGTRFTVYLPRNGEAEAEPAGPAPGLTPRGGETVLVVEDEEAVRSFAVRVLARAGYRVLSAATGETALAAARAHDGPIDLVISDVVMPGMTGPEFAARIAVDRPGVRVLFTSGYAEDAITERGGVAEGGAYLSKPYSVDLLLERVRELLGAPTA